MVLFLTAVVINSWLFQKLEHVPGINWIYLPAGIRLLCTLLFAHAGAFGLLIISWVVSFFYFFPHDPERAFVGGIIGGLSPYLAYLIAQRFWGLAASLANLGAKQLLWLSVGYAFANSSIHHIYFAIRGQPDLLQGLTAMFIGDLGGTLLVLYACKLGLALSLQSVRG
ncbi:hypothetical protein JI739_23805 [Ramlibacter sp. AW1]|uniref:MASE1 domain-containing protein n=2 Tax=Ramlibacter aurantiacus TaxID=2801330 RepID=A0A937D7J4_9BURK|nr:hypothetical protein [Ramlibacter aurantiacus]MBL0423382.1 hypothetical protein [Ramlibacter aurantiacus]